MKIGPPVIRPIRILLVEDSEYDAALLLLELRDAGYQPVSERVETAQGMAAALDRQPWDVVIADYILPKFSGLLALKLLRQRGLDLPFIIVSGHIDEDTAVAAMKAGAHDYVMKDRLTRLVPAIERELEEAESRARRIRVDSPGATAVASSRIPSLRASPRWISKGGTRTSTTLFAKWWAGPKPNCWARCLLFPIGRPKKWEPSSRLWPEWPPAIFPPMDSSCVTATATNAAWTCWFC